MASNYADSCPEKISLFLENGLKITGECIGGRIAAETIPAGKEWYHIRHEDEDWSDLATIKRGCVAVNFYGTFICDRIEGMNWGDEIDITDWDFVND